MDDTCFKNLKHPDHLPSSLPTKSYNSDANNASLDHMVQTLEAKIERTHEMLLQLKKDNDPQASLGLVHQLPCSRINTSRVSW
jgi:hypothetical protein